MTDSSKFPPPADHPGDPKPRGRTGNVPPLAWVIAALLVVIIAWAALGHQKTNTTPQGQEVPAAGTAEGAPTGKGS